jgi:hypothetical protein
MKPGIMQFSQPNDSHLSNFHQFIIRWPRPSHAHSHHDSEALLLRANDLPMMPSLAPSIHANSYRMSWHRLTPSFISYQ